VAIYNFYLSSYQAVKPFAELPSAIQVLIVKGCPGTNSTPKQPHAPQIDMTKSSDTFKGPTTASPLPVPLQALQAEHQLILRVLHYLDAPIEDFATNAQHHVPIIRAYLDFSQHYTDRFHHAKEEEVLFSYFDSRESIITAMQADHVLGRKWIHTATEALIVGDHQTVAMCLRSYRNMLTQHIQTEHAQLFPWIFHRLTHAQIEEIGMRFAAIDTHFQNEKKHFEDWANRLANPDALTR
jgi:hemerythrin-like domain-containing protein